MIVSYLRSFRPSSSLYEAILVTGMMDGGNIQSFPQEAGAFLVQFLEAMCVWTSDMASHSVTPGQ